MLSDASMSDNQTQAPSYNSMMPTNTSPDASMSDNQTCPPSYNSMMPTSNTPGYWPCRPQPFGSSRPLAQMPLQYHPGPPHIAPVSVVRPYLSSQPHNMFFPYGGSNMHPMQYSTPFEEQRTSLGQGSSETPWTFQNAALAVTARPQYPTYKQSAASSAQKLPPPTNLFDSSNASPTVTMPKESRGRKTIDDLACHQDLVQKMSIEFFAVAQSLSLYPFCRANGYIEKYNSVWRFISNNR